MTEIWMKAGEATVFAADGQFTDAMPEVLIGSIRGPVGTAFAGMTGQVAGHPRMLVIRDCNQMVRPMTMMTPKYTVMSDAYVELLGGVVQAATADAIVDLLAEGVIPKDQADELCMIIMIWLDPRCAAHETLDRKNLYDTNYEATKLAITRALTGAPTVDDLIANRHVVQHYALDGIIDA